MISERTKALLQAAATIYAGSFVPPHRADRDGEWKDGYFQMGATDAIAKATDLLERILEREKAQYGSCCPPGRVCEKCPSSKCRWCGHSHSTAPCPPEEPRV